MALRGALFKIRILRGLCEQNNGAFMASDII